jgi:hypothetical protein
MTEKRWRGFTPEDPYEQFDEISKFIIAAYKFFEENAQTTDFYARVGQFIYCFTRTEVRFVNKIASAIRYGYDQDETTAYLQREWGVNRPLALWSYKVEKASKQAIGLGVRLNSILDSVPVEKQQLLLDQIMEILDQAQTLIALAAVTTLLHNSSEEDIDFGTTGSPSDPSGN